MCSNKHAYISKHVLSNKGILIMFYISLLLVALFVSTGVNAADDNSHKRKRPEAESPNDCSYDNYMRQLGKCRESKREWFRHNADKTAFSIDKVRYTEAMTQLKGSVPNVDLGTRKLLKKKARSFAGELRVDNLKKMSVHQKDLVSRLMGVMEFGYMYEKNIVDTELDKLRQERGTAQWETRPGTNFAELVNNPAENSEQEVALTTRFQRLEGAEEHIETMRCMLFSREIGHKERKLLSIGGFIDRYLYSSNKL